MGFLVEYMSFSDGTECPREFRIWSALSLLGTTLGRKIWTMHGRFKIYPSLYICLVGDASSGKSTAKNDAVEIFSELFPNRPVAAAFQSHQDIIDQMCNAEPITWNDKAGQVFAYSPFYIVCNEMSSFLSTDKQGMVNFLIDIYDRNDFSTGFKGQRKADPLRKQKVDNPFVSVLACAVPKWFMGNLKMDLFDSGLGRRMVIVYSEKKVLVDDPTITKEQEKSKEGVKKFLLRADRQSGELVRTPAAMKWWKEWYHLPDRKNKSDPILTQFDDNEHVPVLKVAMLLAMSEEPFTFEIDVPHLQAAVEFLGALKPDIQKLTSGIGRNELAGVGAQLVDYLERLGNGAASMMQLRKYFNRFTRTPEFNEILNHYVETGQVYFAKVPYQGFVQDVLMLPHYFGPFMKEKFPNDPLYQVYLEREKMKANGERHASSEHARASSPSQEACPSELDGGPAAKS